MTLRSPFNVILTDGTTLASKLAQQQSWVLNEYEKPRALITLSNEDLSDVDFSTYEISYIKFVSCNLSRSVFPPRMYYVDFTGSAINNVSFVGVLSQCDLANTTILRTSFIGAEVFGCIFAGANIVSCFFDGIDLSNSVLDNGALADSSTRFTLLPPGYVP